MFAVFYIVVVLIQLSFGQVLREDELSTTNLGGTTEIVSTDINEEFITENITDADNNSDVLITDITPDIDDNNEDEETIECPENCSNTTSEEECTEDEDNKSTIRKIRLCSSDNDNSIVTFVPYYACEGCDGYVDAAAPACNSCPGMSAGQYPAATYYGYSDSAGIPPQYAVPTYYVYQPWCPPCYCPPYPPCPYSYQDNYGYPPYPYSYQNNYGYPPYPYSYQDNYGYPPYPYSYQDNYSSSYAPGRDSQSPPGGYYPGCNGDTNCGNFPYRGVLPARGSVSICKTF